MKTALRGFAGYNTIYSDPSIPGMLWTPGGPPPFVPTQVAGCVLWLRADIGVAKDGSNRVSTWSDQSGAGNHATQTGANATKPLYSTVQGPNGLPTITFDGIGQFLLCDGLATALSGNDVPFSLFALSDVAGGAQGVYFSLRGSSALWPVGWGLDNKLFVWKRDDASTLKQVETTGSAITTSAYSIATIITGGSGKTVGALDGVTVLTSGQDIDVGAATTTSGWIGCDNAVQWFFAGDITELIIYKAELSSGDQSSVITYLKGRSGL
jgi:hypothetical protein